MSKRKLYIFLLLPLSLALIMLLVGCGNTYAGLTTRWLAQGEQETSFYEQATYDLTHKTVTNKEGLAFTLTSGTLTQTIQGANRAIENALINNGTATNYNSYEYKTELTINGQYTYHGQAIEVKDTITSTVLCRISTEGFRPLKSTQIIKATTPEYNAKTKTYTFTKYDYTVDKLYNGDTNTVEIHTTANNNSTSVENSVKTVSNINKKNAPYDSVQLYFVARAMQDATNIVNTITENGIVPTIINLSTGKEKLTFPNTTEEQEFATTNAKISIAGNGIGKGPGRILTFLTSGDFRHTLYRVQETMPYSLGAIVYTLKTITKTPLTP